LDGDRLIGSTNVRNFGRKYVQKMTDPALKFQEPRVRLKFDGLDFRKP